MPLLVGQVEYELRLLHPITRSTSYYKTIHTYIIFYIKNFSNNMRTLNPEVLNIIAIYDYTCVLNLRCLPKATMCPHSLENLPSPCFHTPRLVNLMDAWFGSGYVPPEYVKQGLYSRKFDVYSFGVLLLQVISSKRNDDVYGANDFNLLEYASKWAKFLCL